MGAGVGVGSKTVGAGDRILTEDVEMALADFVTFSLTLEEALLDAFEMAGEAKTEMVAEALDADARLADGVALSTALFGVMLTVDTVALSKARTAVLKDALMLDTLIALEENVADTANEGNNAGVELNLGMNVLELCDVRQDDV